MTPNAPHTMDAQWIEDQLTTRYVCRQCARWVEDGPEGLRVVVRGDLHVVHRGGVLRADADLAESATDGGFGPTAPGVLH
jgi:hypothetical protein